MSVPMTVTDNDVGAAEATNDIAAKRTTRTGFTAWLAQCNPEGFDVRMAQNRIVMKAQEEH